VAGSGGGGGGRPSAKLKAVRLSANAINSSSGAQSAAAASAGPGAPAGAAAGSGRAAAAGAAAAADPGLSELVDKLQAIRGGCSLDWSNCCVFSLHKTRGPLVQPPPAWPLPCTAAFHAAMEAADLVSTPDYAASGPHFLDWKALAEKGCVSMAAAPMFSCKKPVAVLCLASDQVRGLGCAAARTARHRSKRLHPPLTGLRDGCMPQHAGTPQACPCCLEAHDGSRQQPLLPVVHSPCPCPPPPCLQPDAFAAADTVRQLAGALAPYAQLLDYTTRRMEMAALVNQIITPIAAQLAQQKQSQLARLGGAAGDAANASSATAAASPPAGTANGHAGSHGSACSPGLRARTSGSSKTVTTFEAAAANAGAGGKQGGDLPSGISVQR